MAILFIFVIDLSNKHEKQYNKELAAGQAENKDFVTTSVIFCRNLLK
jgi:hypothetical protein